MNSNLLINGTMMAMLLSSCGDSGQGQKKAQKVLPESSGQENLEKPQAELPSEKQIVVPREFAQAYALLSKGISHESGGVVLDGGCITGDTPSEYILDGDGEPMKKPDGQKVYASYAEIKNMSDLRRETGYEVNGEGFYSGVKAKAGLSFSSKISQSSSERNVLYTVTVENADVRLRNVRLTKTAAELAKTDPVSFYKRCGTRAIVGYKSGGQANVFMKVRSDKKITEESMAAVAEASGFGFSGSGKMADKSYSKVEGYNVEISQHLEGGNSLKLENRIDEVIKYTSEWPKHVAEHPVVVEYITIPYSKLVAGLVDANTQILNEQRQRYIDQYDRLRNFQSQAAQLVVAAKLANKNSQGKVNAEKIADAVLTIERDYEKLELLKYQLYRAINACYQAKMDISEGDVCLTGNMKLLNVDPENKFDEKFYKGGVWNEFVSDKLIYDAETFEFKNLIVTTEDKMKTIMEPVYETYKEDYRCGTLVAFDRYTTSKEVCGTAKAKSCKAGYKQSVKINKKGSCVKVEGPFKTGVYGKREYVTTCTREEVPKMCKRDRKRQIGHRNKQVIDVKDGVVKLQWKTVNF